MKPKKLITIIICLFSMVAMVSIPPVTEVKALDPAKTILCNLGDDGKTILKATRTDYVPYMLASKSTTNKSDPTDNIFNKMLRAAGYDIGGENGENPFEKFGMSGIKYNSYTGEWKYYDVDPCSDNPQSLAKSTNYGEYYDGRKDPLSTYGEISSTTDVRTKEYARGRFSAFTKAINDNVANIFVYMSKFVVSLMLVLFSLSLSDFSSMLGFNEEAQASMVKSFYSGIFMPLVTLMILLTAVFLMYKMLVKREIREGLSMLLKVIASFLIAVVLGTHPQFVTLPAKLVNMVQAVVVSATTTAFPSDGKYDLCESSKGKKLTNTDKDSETYNKDTADYIKSVIGCRIWSEYLMKPTVRGQFGTEYKNLDTLKNENSAWVGKPIVKINGKDIENWGLYYVSVMSGNHSVTDGYNTSLVNGINKDYYRIIDALSNYDEDEIEDPYGASGGSGGFSDEGGASESAGDWTKEGTKAYKIAKTAFKILTEKYGLSGRSAAGILGNIESESGFVVDMIEKEWGQSYDGRGYGLFQFTPKEKYLNSKFYKKGRSLEEEIEAQVDFVMSSEFKNGAYKSYLRNCNSWFGFSCNIDDLFGSDNEQKAMLSFFSTYERGDVSLMHPKRRKSSALTANKLFNKDEIKADKSKWPIKGGGSSSSGGSGSSDFTDTSEYGSSNGLIPVPKNNPPLEQWDSFIGNNQGERVGYAVVMFVFSVINSILPLIFSLLSTVYGVGITILSVISPIFLLFGCWGGKGSTILNKYIGTFVSTCVKKIVSTLMAIVSIIIGSLALQYINEWGVFKTSIFLLVLVIILYKKKDQIFSKLSSVTGNSFNLSKLHEATNKVVKRPAKLGAETLVVGAVGARSAKKHGGSAMQGFMAATKNNLGNAMYRSETGRKAMIVYNSNIKGEEGAIADRNRHCVQCGDKLLENTTAYADELGNYYCEVCAASLNYEDMYMVQIDNILDEGVDVTRNNDQTQIKDETGQDKEVTYFTTKEFADILSEDSEATPEANWENNKKKIDNRVNESIGILGKDLKRAEKNGDQTGHKYFNNGFIPEPLRGSITPQQMKKVVAERDVEKYKKLILDGWEDWYIMNSKNAKGADYEIPDKEMKEMRTTWEKIIEENIKE